VRPRKLFLSCVAALLGIGLVVLPAVATSETTPAIKALNSTGIYQEQTHSWSPPTATITAGGAVLFSNPTTVKHGIDWVYGPATPDCSGIPVGSTEADSGTEWNGTCKFTTPGLYTFYCTVHGAKMAGSITVNANGEPTAAVSPQPTQTATGTAAPAPLPPAVAPLGAAPGSSAMSSPLAGSASSAVKLPALQHGQSIHGSVIVSAAGAGGRLEVVLLAKGASLASAGHAGQVRVGRLLRSSLIAGPVSFAVALNADAKHALRSHRRLSLTARLLLAPLSGSPVRISRSLVLHA
jgi:plastocyanin